MKKILIQELKYHNDFFNEIKNNGCKNKNNCFKLTNSTKISKGFYIWETCYFCLQKNQEEMIINNLEMIINLIN